MIGHVTARAWRHETTSTARTLLIDDRNVDERSTASTAAITREASPWR
jgi:hypothetical protein